MKSDGRSRQGGLWTWIRRHQIQLLTGVLVPFALFVLTIVVTRPGPSPTNDRGNGGGAASTQSNSAVLTETQVRYLRPFTDQGLPADYTVQRVADGECLGQSRTSADPEALRCIYDDPDTGDSPILDPCWADLERTQVACPETPWDRDVVLMEHVTLEDQPIDPPTIDPEKDPFAIEILTPDGRTLRCKAIVAFAGTFAGFRRNYACDAADGTSEVGFVFGELDRSRSLWRVRFAPPTSRELVFVTVETAWM
jgi:hypothetical protein